MNRAIATLAIGDGVLHPKSLASFEAAASRWGADLVIFREPLHDCHFWWQKTFAIDHLVKYDQVLQLDADMLIAENCPAPWALHVPGKLGMVRDIQYRKQRRWAWWLRRSTECWAKILSLPNPTVWALANAGLQLYCPAEMLSWYRLLRALGRSQKFPRWGLGDQGLLNLLSLTFRFRCYLPDAWNATGAGTHWRDDLPAQMDASIYHFCAGVQGRAARIEATEWRSAETTNPTPVSPDKSADQDTVR